MGISLCLLPAYPTQIHICIRVPNVVTYLDPSSQHLPGYYETITSKHQLANNHQHVRSFCFQPSSLSSGLYRDYLSLFLIIVGNYVIICLLGNGNIVAFTTHISNPDTYLYPRTQCCNLPISKQSTLTWLLPDHHKQTPTGESPSTCPIFLFSTMNNYQHNKQQHTHQTIHQR